MTTTLSDLRLGLRLFLRTPGTALAAVLSLGLGIGANTAIFSVLHAVVLSPLPYDAAERLVIVWETSADNAERWVAPANFVDWRRDLRSFSSLAAFDEFRPTMTTGAEPEVVRAVGASGTFFTTLGVGAARGRVLVPSDDEPGAEGVAVLSHGLWQRAFGEAPGVVGQTLTLDGRRHTIVGVMPAAFESPLQSSSIDVWVNGDRGVPRTFPFSGDIAAVRDSHLLFVIGRLAPGVSRDVAQREITAAMLQLSKRYPDTNAGLGGNVRSLHEQVVGNVRGLVLLLQLAVGMMLLIACANVAHLLLGQAAGRHAEMSMRVALGAGRGRLMRQMCAETLVIAVPGGIVGVLLAVWGLAALAAARPQALPRLQEISIDLPVLGFTTLVTLLTVVVFGLGPAIHLARYSTAGQPQSPLRATGARSVRRWHHALVVTELAVAHVLLIGAGLLLASFLAAQHVPLGFESANRVAADLTLSAERYLQPVSADDPRIDTAPKERFVARVFERLRAAPNVHAAGASFTSPLTGAPNRGISIQGRPARGPGQQDTADFQVVSTDFFRAVGAAIVRGRDFSDSDRDTTPRVALVNQAFVDRYFPGQEPIGQRLQFGRDSTHEIIGIVADMRYRSIESPADPTFYLPITQNTERWPFMSFTVWSDGGAATTTALLRAAVRDADPAQALTRVRSFDDVLSTALSARRFNTVLVVAFAGAALLLAAVGTYGVMAYAVSVRTRELGVRAALGAAPNDLLRLVLREGALLTAAAVAMGVVAGLAVSGATSALLFEVTPRDARTFTAVATMLTIVALLATWIPARRAIRVDPSTALRDS
jgi:putative ABC transport system permease protein